MKKLAAPLLLALAVAVSGCASSGTAPTNTAPTAGAGEGVEQETEGGEVSELDQEVVAPADLSGAWKQSNSQSPDDFMTAVVSDGVISVDWELGSQDIKAVYWVGTFTAPVDSAEPYSWASQRDAAATDSALMASTDNVKEFTYENGTLTFAVSIQGESATVEMTKQ